jgi:DNA-binding transcriptional regulator YhcF (GntR family)
MTGRPSSAPEITVDASLPVPPYEQIRRQIADLIRAGVLADGTRLPPVRQLAVDLGLAVGTVARAYQELEAASLVATSRGGGTRVVGVSGPAPSHREALLAARAREYVTEARRLGAVDEEALSAIRAALSP